MHSLMQQGTDGAVTWPVNKVRRVFVDFFKERGHTLVPSSPVVPANDPTLLFINAGMNQFKRRFLGDVDANTELGRLKRAVNSQLCIRAGGKHNDLNDVGKDTYHHTFFEMLGTWSFGDYFKAEAIAWAWELLTTVYGLAPDRLYATYFEGNPSQNLLPDEETKALWGKYLPADRILPGDLTDNFWEMGDVGPCGPCSELHYDRIGGRNAASRVNQNEPDVIEVWNIVFMQYDRQPDKSLQQLPQKHVDAGMGLERITSILQGENSNYNTDLWAPIFSDIQRITRFPSPYCPAASAMDDATVAYRVVADHARCVTVALADGAAPDATGRGFVLRRIVRRAIRYGAQFLNADTGFFSELIDVVSASLADFFPHLVNPNVVARTKAILRAEEESFAKTWSVGLKHFEAARAATVQRGSTVVSGKDAFILHDRYGFPVDLTALLAEKVGLTVDLQGFQHKMKASQIDSTHFSAQRAFFNSNEIEDLKKQSIIATDDAPKYVWEASTGQIRALYSVPSSAFVPSVDEGVLVGVVLDRTNFYAEQGGQIYDVGTITTSSGLLRVDKVFVIGGYVAHIGTVERGSLHVGDETTLDVDYERRKNVAANHTTTHLLNFALRKVLQDQKGNLTEIQQRGSLVTAEMLRFDFSYHSKLAAEDLEEIERLMNRIIASQCQVYRQVMPLEEATTINGIRHLAGEGYPSRVAVLSIGAPLDRVLAARDSAEWREHSIELCGGTHLTSMGDAQKAVIVSEEALMKGIRRVVVYTRGMAFSSERAAQVLERELEELSDTVKGSPDAAVKALSVLGKKINDSTIPLGSKTRLRAEVERAIRGALALHKQRASQWKQQATEDGKKFASELLAQAPGRTAVVYQLDTYSAREAVQRFTDAAREVVPSLSLMVLATGGEKGLALATVSSEALQAGFTAVAWVKAACGLGGGKDGAAQAGFDIGDVEAIKRKATTFATTCELKVTGRGEV